MMTAIPVTPAPQLKAPETAGSTLTDSAGQNRPQLVVNKPLSDSFKPQKPNPTGAKPKASSQLGDEKQWFINGALLTGATGFVISSVWLWVVIGTKRFTKWEGLHANIPMATIGGLVTGSALGGFSCRFINSIKNRLNGTVTEKPEAIVDLPVDAKP